MMDFLRRLAPLHEADATRAVAVLPSRFADDGPLRAVTAQARPAQPLDDNTASLWLDALPYAAVDRSPAQRPITGGDPSQAAPRRLAASPPHPNSVMPTSPSIAPAKAPEIDPAGPRASQVRHGIASERARLTSAGLQGPVAQQLATGPPPAKPTAAKLADEPPGQTAAPQLRARVAPPLSASILAQRMLQSRDDGQAVHVTIGRIDVVAATAPAPAMRPSQAPRQGTVPLADYLRSGR